MPTLYPVPPLSRSTRIRYAAAALGPVLLAAAVGTLATLPNLHWYAGLHRPSFRPPNWLFGPVWTVLYVVMAWAFYRILRSPDWMPDRRAATRAFLVQIGLNAAWPVAFFGLHSPRLGLVVIGALLVAVVDTARLFGRIDRTAGLSLLPYLLWGLFALALNLSVYVRN